MLASESHVSVIYGMVVNDESLTSARVVRSEIRLVGLLWAGICHICGPCCKADILSGSSARLAFEVHSQTHKSSTLSPAITSTTIMSALERVKELGSSIAGKVSLIRCRRTGSTSPIRRVANEVLRYKGWQSLHLHSISK